MNSEKENKESNGRPPAEDIKHSNNDKPRQSQQEQRFAKPRRMRVSPKPIAITFSVGVVILILGLATGLCWTQIYDWIFKRELSLTPTSTNFKMWKETPIPMYIKLYMFNWTNPEKFSADSTEKPNFVEMGPYVFRQVDYKVNHIWNDNNTITFQRRRIWHFEESLSAGTLDDKVTNLNPVAATVGYSLRYKSKFMRDLAGRLMNALGEKLVVTRSVGELLFDGYNDTMLRIAQKLKLSSMPFDKFGWFYSRNGSDTYDGVFNIDTGAADMLQLGMMKEWNYRNRTDNYYGECGRITGSNGEIWPPLEDSDIAPVFVTDICTNINLEYKDTITVMGLEAKEFHATESALDNGERFPERKCYCEGIECVPSGMLNVSSCKFNAPIFVSLPHFYLADPSYLDAITGLKPSDEEHDMSLVVQPKTGIPIRVRAQMQLNLMILPDPHMSMFKNVRKTFVPMLWFAQEANLTTTYASLVKFIIILPLLGTVTTFGIAGIGLLIAFIGVILFARRKWQGEDAQVLLTEEDSYDVSRTNE